MKRSYKTHRSGWIRVEDRLPRQYQEVLASYKGVYDYRIVIFWKEKDGTPHFGAPHSLDGRGSQPATHWCPLPPLPK